MAGAERREVAATAAPTTAGRLLKRFGAGQCGAVLAAMAALGNRFDHPHELPVSAPVTLDMDGSLSAVYGPLEEMASFNNEGRRGFLSVFAGQGPDRAVGIRRAASATRGTVLCDLRDHGEVAFLTSEDRVGGRLSREQREQELAGY